MKYQKQILGELEKCYAVSPLRWRGQDCLLAAAEKSNPCRVFSRKGELLDTVWEAPGGVMTMVPVPDRDGVFLATQKFYSPNDSAQAYLICAVCGEDGWTLHKIADVPFVHRFDIFSCEGVQYVLVCTLKSGHEYKNDWRFPGKLWTAVLPDDPTQPLELKELRGGLGHNHGYTRCEEKGRACGLVSCDEGVFLVHPPETAEGEWRVEKLLNAAASDAVRMDLDGDGRPELFTISPFHGNQISVWHQDDQGAWTEVYHHEKELPFLHAITGGVIYGCPSIFAGNREGEQQMLRFWYDSGTKEYRYEVVDEHVGPANCMLFEREGHPALLATNREISEIAVYDILDE